MKHYIKDIDENAIAYISTGDGELCVSVCIEEKGLTYYFDIDEYDLQLIAFMIKQSKEDKK